MSARSLSGRTFQIDSRAEFRKVGDELGIVFGWAIICTEGGKPYFDSQGEHIPEAVMLKAAADFMANARVSTDMHARDGEAVVPDGRVIFGYPITTEMVDALEMKSKRTGLLVGLKPSAAVLAKCKAGEHVGFSIGGRYIEVEEVIT